MSKRYDYFIFDWDGCLAKTLEVWLEASKQELARENITHFSDKEICRYIGSRDATKVLGFKDPDASMKRLIANGTELLKTVELYDHAAETLEMLKKKDKKMAVVSSSPRALLLRSLQYNQLEAYFDIVISGDDVTHYKPHPEGIEAALAAIDGSKTNSLMIGDSDKDLGAAANANIDSALVYHPSHTLFYDLQELRHAHNPTHVVMNFKELQRLAG